MSGSGKDVLPGCSSFMAALGLALLPILYMLSRRFLSSGDSVRSTLPFEPPLLSLRKLKPRERALLGEVVAWSMLMVGVGM